MAQKETARNWKKKMKGRNLKGINGLKMEGKEEKKNWIDLEWHKRAAI
jgi:hypothetical protein